MSDQIQAARDTLARWGERATPGPWVNVADWTEDVAELRASDGNTLGWMHRPADAALIVAMTDPALREALDGMLQKSNPGNPFMYDPWDDDSVDPTNTDEVVHTAASAGWDAGAYAVAERIAAVILDIDGRVGA